MKEKKKNILSSDSTETASPINCYASQFDHSRTIFLYCELLRLTHDVEGRSQCTCIDARRRSRNELIIRFFTVKQNCLDSNMMQKENVVLCNVFQ